MLRLLKICPTLTARTIKQITGLIKLPSVDLTVITKPKFNHLLAGFINEQNFQYREFNFKNNFLFRYRFRQILEREGSEFDLIHCHNEPNYPTADTIKVLKHKTPILFDIHDMSSSRTGVVDRDEMFSYTHAAAVLHVSPEFIEIGNRLFGEQNTYFLYSASLNSDGAGRKKNIPDPNSLHFVYQGGIFDDSWKGKDQYRYRNYFPMFKEILEEGHHLHLFTRITMESLPSYLILAKDHERFHHHGLQDYTTLIQEMRTFDVGLAGFNYETISEPGIEYLNGAMGNKLFDYLQAELPVIVFNAKAMANFVSLHNCGSEKLPEFTWTQTAAQLPERSFKDLLLEYSQERQTEKLMSIYREVIKNHKS